MVNDLTGNKAAIALQPARNWDRSGKRYGDPAKARVELGFAAMVGLRDGLARTIDWSRRRYELIARDKAARALHARDPITLNRCAGSGSRDRERLPKTTQPAAGF
jgi:hypothetical protein